MYINLDLCFFLIICLEFVSFTREEIYSSGAELEQLANAEFTILNALQTYLQKDIDRLSTLENYVNDIRIEVSDSQKKKQHNVGHPINALHIIRRFVTAWQEVFNQIGNFTHYNEMRSIVGMSGKYLPNNDDFLGAQRSLIRLQQTYQLRTSHLVQGKVMEKEGKELTEYDCFLLGQRAMETKRSPTTAIEWFEEAKRRASPGHVPLQRDASTALAELYARVHNYHAAVKQSKEAYKISNGDSRLRDLVMVYEKQREAWLHGYPTPGWEPPTEIPEFWINYEYLCRYSATGKFKISMEDEDRTCHYHFIHSSYVPHKVEVLSLSPRILHYYDFISDTEADNLKEHVLPKMQRARVGVTGDNEASEDRVGKVWGVEDSEYDWIRKFNRRVEHTFHLNTAKPAGEPLQVLNYGLGGQYYPHYDFDQHRNKRKDMYQKTGQNGYEIAGDRIATLLLYLNEVTLGGGTVFPEILVAIPPIKNSAIFWYNAKDFGEGDMRMLHAGCPVLHGQKWVANKWFREIGHELHRKCDSFLQNTI